MSYRFLAVKMALKAMSVSTKVSIRTDGEGVLSMNFMIDLDGTNVFVEFRVDTLRCI
jgi:cell cycle checkpoint protein